MRFSSSHEWLQETSESLVKIGLTHYAQDELGEIVFVDFPKPGAILKTGDVLVMIESVKTASDIISPIGGTVVEINTVLKDNPGMINTAAETEGWMVLIRPDSSVDWGQFMSREDYGRYVPT